MKKAISVMSRFLLALALRVMVCGMALVQGLVDDYVAVCHFVNNRHFMRHKYNGGLPGQLFYDSIQMPFKNLVDIRQRLIKHKHAGT